MTKGFETDIVLFPNFLHDRVEYRRSWACWEDHWRELVAHAGQGGEWETPWLDNQYANGVPCCDGNPIFSAVCRGRRLGVRVIQLEPSANPRDLSFWTDRFAAGEPEEVKELVISCVLTKETLLDALGLMKRWIMEETVPA